MRESRSGRAPDPISKGGPRGSRPTLSAAALSLDWGSLFRPTATLSLSRSAPLDRLLVTTLSLSRSVTLTLSFSLFRPGFSVHGNNLFCSGFQLYISKVTLRGMEEWLCVGEKILKCAN